MATTRSIGTQMVPTLTSTKAFYASGDDLTSQVLVSDDPAGWSSTVGGTGFAPYCDAVSFAINTKHRPLGQRGSHRPQITGKCQFLQEDGRPAVLNCHIGFSVENGMSVACNDGTRTSDLGVIAKFARALLAGCVAGIIDPTNAGSLDNDKVEAAIKRFLAGIISASA